MAQSDKNLPKGREPEKFLGKLDTSYPRDYNEPDIT